MTKKLLLINEYQAENVLIRSFIHAEDRTQIDARIITDVKKILQAVLEKKLSGFSGGVR